jgi:hypothetical protein
MTLRLWPAKSGLEYRTLQIQENHVILIQYGVMRCDLHVPRRYGDVDAICCLGAQISTRSLQDLTEIVVE